MKNVIIYTDGACSGNPGIGGFGVILRFNGNRREISEGFRKTTNNRMELMAVIAGLETLKEKCSVTLFTDSQYIVNSITRGWARRWREKGWMRNKKEKALNPDLWDKLLKLCEYHQVEIRWVRGHAGDPENERADKLAVEAMRQKDLLIDEVYENTAAR
ncbi:MAG: ribonuclease HI [Calditrichia bacterium]